MCSHSLVELLIIQSFLSIPDPFSLHFLPVKCLPLSGRIAACSHIQHAGPTLAQGSLLHEQQQMTAAAAHGDVILDEGDVLLDAQSARESCSS